MAEYILIVEDSAGAAELERRTLERSGYLVRTSGTGTEAMNTILADGSPDLMLVDYRLPDMSGVDLMRKILEKGLTIPSVMVTAAGNENVAVSAMKLGAMDYVVKSAETMQRLPEVCSEVLKRVRLQNENQRLMDELQRLNDELMEANRRLEDQSRRDYLTGVYNRRHLIESLEHECSRSRRYEAPLTIALFDLDHFKNVNDSYGHLTGDHVLCQFTALVKKRLRVTDVFGRYGGEEFAIIFTDTPIDKSASVCEAIRAMVEAEPFGAKGTPVRLTTSVGVAGFAPPMNADELIDAADRSLYAAKEAGRNTIKISGQ